MQILLLLPDLPLSGAATRTVHLAEDLANQDLIVKVATFVSPVDVGLESRLSRSGIQTLRLQSLLGLRSLVQFIRQDPDTVIHAAMPTAGLVALVLGRLMDRPVAYSYTNCLHEQRPFRIWSLVDQAKAVVERVMASRADALHAVSAGVALQIQRLHEGTGGRLNALTHPATQPIAEGHTAGGTGLTDRFPGAHPRLLCVGRLLPHKRFVDAIRATALLKQRWPKIQLLVAGNGPERSRLMALVDELDLGDNVTLLGESRLLRPMFLWADVFVHPSLYEGYPRVIAEACAHSLPVVAVDTPYGREAAQGNNVVLLARPMDSDSLARAITTSMHQRFYPLNMNENIESFSIRMLEMYEGALRQRQR